MEGVGNAIGKIVTFINTLVKRLVENFSKMMEKNKVDKTIKELEKLPKDTKVKVDIDMKEAAETYEDLIDEYGKAVQNPTKASKIKDKTEKAKNRRKKILVASTVTVGAILTWLKLLKNSNDYKRYKKVELSDVTSSKISKNIYDMYAKVDDRTDYSVGRDEKGRSKMGAVKYKDFLFKQPNKTYTKEEFDKIKKHYKYYNDKKIKEAEEIYSQYIEAMKGLEESEHYRLVLYKNIFKSIKSIAKFAGVTIHDGVSMIGKKRYDNEDVNIKKDSVNAHMSFLKDEEKFKFD